jgi:hypothetical protein
MSEWTGIKTWQERLDFVKSAILAGMLILFLVYPDAFWYVLQRAGLNLKELSVFGATLEKTSSEANVDLKNALNESKLTNEALTKDLTSAKDALAQVNDCFSTADRLASCAKDKKLLAGFEQMHKDAVQAEQASRQLSTTIASTLTVNANVIDKAELTVAAQSSSWGIIFGGDSTQQAAEDEIKKARKLNVASLAIYAKQGAYRSVALYGSRDAANQAVPSLKVINPGAYVVELTRWCRNPQKQDNAMGYTYAVCQ